MPFKLFTGLGIVLEYLGFKSNNRKISKTTFWFVERCYPCYMLYIVSIATQTHTNTHKHTQIHTLTHTNNYRDTQPHIFLSFFGNSDFVVF